MNSITVVAVDEVGLEAAVTALLAGHGINVTALVIEKVRRWAIVRLMVERDDAALAVLRGGGFVALSQETLLVQVEDRPGSVAHVTRTMHQANIGVRSACIVGRDEERSLVSLVTDQCERAKDVLRGVLLSAS